MIRGVRKSPMEKLHEQLNEVQESIRQYQTVWKLPSYFEVKGKDLQSQFELEEFKSIRGLLTEQGIGMEELKEMLESNVTAVEEQSA